MLGQLFDFQQFDTIEYGVLNATCIVGTIVLANFSEEKLVVVSSFPAALVGAWIGSVLLADVVDFDAIPGKIEGVLVGSTVGMTVAVLAVLVAYRHFFDPD